MIALTLIHFNVKVGPRIFLSAPELFNEQDYVEILANLAFFNKGFFIHIFENVKSGNLSFGIKNEIMRRGEEMLILSINS